MLKQRLLVCIASTSRSSWVVTEPYSTQVCAEINGKSQSLL